MRKEILYDNIILQSLNILLPGILYYNSYYYHCFWLCTLSGSYQSSTFYRSLDCPLKQLITVYIFITVKCY